MNKNVVRIILSAFAVIILTAVLIFGLTGGFNMFKFNFNFNFRTFGAYTYPDSDLYSKGNAEISADGIEKLDIDWISDSVKVETYSGSTISISESESEKLNEDEKLCYLVRDGVLHIRFWSPKKGQVKWGFDKKKHLTVLIPESVSGFKTCQVETVSANMSIKDIAADEFKLNSTSGDISLNAKGKANHINTGSTSGNIEIKATAESIDFESTSGTIRYAGEAQKIDGESTSGDIRCDASVKTAEFNTTSGNIIFEGKAETLNFESTSGDVTVNAQSNKIKCNTVSGSFVLNGEVNEIKCDASSGDVSIDSAVCPSKADVETTSGQIILTIHGDKGFTAMHDTTSGKFSCDFAVKTSEHKAVYGDGSAQFNLSSTSGDIMIKEK